MTTTGRQNWAAVIGDVIGSRQASSRASLQRRLGKALSSVNEALEPVQPLTLTLGDEFQGMFVSVEDAIEASFRLRLELVDQVKFRIGIGWGSLKTQDPIRTPFGQDGPCWWRARDALEELARTERSNQEPGSLRTVCRTANAREPMFNAVLVLRDQILSGLDPADAIILKHLIAGSSQQDAADELKVHKSSVSRRMQTHGLSALLRARQHLAASI